ncbi:hypothetical protein CONCODRAFT_12547 [Conidiobolus coronatus NRRL 28638]|uniref:Uncharacterized protein n=1 Tax=Conidiobolus coronatus (strain ATCC 28846 / CBS 209.66 / NRRL 28638) TaxID=796925 RepID=A0A137NSM4_CONC2|nr:hypothetical protein CONCODRAFT_12547 [Conidiobolus coronatus NRRL 28638]|eukprot:KXN65769.1 hypothetical protein CONCODRAFT_12547 [Conidiobolus coronatus NRRL 28638]
MLLSSITIKFALFVIGFGGIAFADSQVKNIQPNSNGDIDAVDRIREQNLQNWEAKQDKFVPINEKNISKALLQDVIKSAQSEAFNNQILSLLEENELKAFKEALTEAIATSQKDESVADASDYQNAVEKLQKAMNVKAIMRLIISVSSLGRNRIEVGSFGELAFASNASKADQTDYLENYFETVNKSEAQNNSIMRINSIDLEAPPEENSPEREKFISKLNLKDDIRMAQDEFFRQRF